jgi:hypothetical protein
VKKYKIRDFFFDKIFLENEKKINLKLFYKNIFLEILENENMRFINKSRLE